MRRERKAERSGFTLMELVAVMAILSIIVLVAVSRTGVIGERARLLAAESDLKTIREAFVDPAVGYLRDFRGIPGFSLGYLRIANLLISTNLYGSVAGDSSRPTGFRVDDELAGPPVRGCASASAFVRWDATSERGWRGPYLRQVNGSFPAESARRFADDTTFASRGFYPPLDGLREPADFIDRRDGCSVYGFPDEPAVLDPWGNPYVLQIPPPQAFPGGNTNLRDEVRFRYARVVSAGPDGRLETPCFGVNLTNHWETTWSERVRRLSRQAGRYGDDISTRGDDLVLFLERNDIDEGRDDE